MNLQEIREKYPEYNDLSDQQLADSLYKSSYSDMDKSEFYSKIGFSRFNAREMAEQTMNAVDTMREATSNIPGQLKNRAVAGLEYMNEPGAVKRSAEGLWDAVTSPIDTAKNLYNYYDEQYLSKSQEERNKAFRKDPVQPVLDFAVGPLVANKAAKTITKQPFRMIDDAETTRLYTEAARHSPTFDKPENIKYGEQFYIDKKNLDAESPEYMASIEANMDLKSERIGEVMRDLQINFTDKKGSIAKVKQAIDIQNRNINAAINEYGNVEIPLKRIITEGAVDDLITSTNKFSINQDGLLREIKKQVDDLRSRYGETVTMKEAHEFKKDIYRQIEQIYGRDKVEPIHAQVLEALAKNAKDAVEEVFDSTRLNTRKARREGGFDIKAANKKLQALIETEQNIPRITGKFGNRSFMTNMLHSGASGGIAGGAIGTAFGGGAGGFVGAPIGTFIGAAAGAYNSPLGQAKRGMVREQLKRAATQRGLFGDFVNAGLPAIGTGLLYAGQEE